MAALAAAAALVLMLLSALVQPSTAAADPIDLSSSRPEETGTPEAPEAPESLAPDQSILATPSESASDGPTVPPAEETTSPPVETGSETPSATDSPSDPVSTDPPPSETQSPTGAGSSEPPVSPAGGTSSGTTTTPPVVPGGSEPSSTEPTGGTTTTPVKPVETEPAPAVENVQWRKALISAASASPTKSAPTTLAPSVNTVPVVTARAVCGGIVFANPDGAYPAAVTYGDFDQAPATPLTLEPVTTKFVAISTERVDWAALSADPGSGASTDIVGAAGFGSSVSIPGCHRDPGAIHVVAMAPCLARGQDAVIMVDDDNETTASSELSWRISRQGDPLVLAQGVLGRTGASSVDLSSFGVGTYNVAVLQNGKVADEVDFAALDCVATVADCQQIRVTNPIRNPGPVTVTWRTDGSDRGRAKKASVVTLPPGGETFVKTAAGSLQWSAISTASRSASATLVGDAGSDLTEITDTCASTPSDRSTGQTSGPGTPEVSTATPVTSSASGRVDPSGTVSSGDGSPVETDPGDGVASSAALLAGIAVGGAALVWLLAALLRRR